tara:strand:+ start:53 stop:196 length:144 start_codon:yes stop_codon:yes gene_type:complete
VKLSECGGAENKLNSIPDNKSKGFFSFKMLEFTIGVYFIVVAQKNNE